MSENPNELTIENSVLVLIDHQPAVAVNVHSIDHGLLINNTAALASVAKALGVPTVLTTVGAYGSVLVDPIFKEISEAFPDITPIDRPSSHAWSHPDVRAAVEATGRTKLVMAGLVTEVCLAQSVLAARKDGFDVYFISDCSGGVTKEAHDDAKVRMTMAGAKPLNWMALTGEWAPYWASPERAVVSKASSQRGDSTNAMVTDWIMDQVTADVVPAPDFISEPVQAGARPD
jgi:nicotinamidase-related amidase